MSETENSRSSNVEEVIASGSAADLERLLSESREQIALGEVLTADQLFAHLKP